MFCTTCENHISTTSHARIHISITSHVRVSERAMSKIIITIVTSIFQKSKVEKNGVQTAKCTMEGEDWFVAIGILTCAAHL